jgi:polysaccharide biosynthesis/export protein
MRLDDDRQSRYRRRMFLATRMMMILARSNRAVVSMRFAMTLSAALALSACGGRVPPPDPSIARVEDLATLPVPVPADLFDRSQPYRVGPLDIISYSVLNMAGMQGELQVDAGGRILIPIVGPIDAAGLTTAELADRVRQSLRRNYVRDPQVTFNLVRIQSQSVTVDGSVTVPGNYPMVNDMTLVRSIAAARGLAETGSDQDVVVLRTIEGRRYAAFYSLRAIRLGAYPDPRIYANDTIIVGRSNARELWRSILQLAPLFVSPLVVLLQNNTN